MKKVLLEAWRQAVIDEMAAVLPQFSLVSSRERGEERNLLKFAWTPRDPLTCGIALRPLDDEFDVWIGWSTNGQFPYLAAQLSPAPRGPWDFAHPAVMVPAIALSGRHGAAAWKLWEPSNEQLDDPAAFAQAFVEYAMKEFTAAEAKERVAPLVARAIEEAKAHGLPYLEKRIASLP